MPSSQQYVRTQIKASSLLKVAVRFNVWGSNNALMREPQDTSFPSTCFHYFGFPATPRKCLNFQVKAPCHGRGRGFESRRSRHILQHRLNRQNLHHFAGRSILLDRGYLAVAFARLQHEHCRMGGIDCPARRGRRNSRVHVALSGSRISRRTEERTDAQSE